MTSRRPVKGMFIQRVQHSDKTPTRALTWTPSIPKSDAPVRATDINNIGTNKPKNKKKREKTLLRYRKRKASQRIAESLLLPD